MKKAILIVMWLLSISSVQAGIPDIIVEFNSNILANTCTIRSQSQNMSVDLGSYTHWELSNYENKRVNDFSIFLDECGTSATYVNMYFTGSAPYQNTLLQTTSMHERNVGVEVYHYPSGIRMSFVGGVPFKVKLTPNTTNEIKFGAVVRPAIYAKTVVPGPIYAVMNYTLEYL